jgi:membrane protein implicated in regulation of membrane protease activity
MLLIVWSLFVPFAFLSFLYVSVLRVLLSERTYRKLKEGRKEGKEGRDDRGRARLNGGKEEGREGGRAVGRRV